MFPLSTPLAVCYFLFLFLNFSRLPSNFATMISLYFLFSSGNHSVYWQLLCVYFFLIAITFFCALSTGLNCLFIKFKKNWQCSSIDLSHSVKSLTIHTAAKGYGEPMLRQKDVVKYLYTYIL